MAFSAKLDSTKSLKVLSFLILLGILQPSFGQDTLFNKTMSEIVIKSTGKKESNVAVINAVRNSSVVSDAMSAETIKKTPDRTAGESLKRVNGLSIQNDKFVLVRGLSDRYNLAMLNKTLLPSTEPDRRSFSFDLVPSNLIDNIMVMKSSMASLPGDFGGGVIQINTKEVAGNFFTVAMGSGFGTLSSFQDFTSVDFIKFPGNFPSTYVFRTASNGDRRSFTKLMPTLTPNNFTSLPNRNSAISFGLKRGKFNLLFSSNGRRSYSLNFTERKDFQSSSELAYDYKDTSASQISSINALLNLTYLGEAKYSWKTIFNHQRENSFLRRSGENYDNVQEISSTSSNHAVKTTLTSQFEFDLKNFDLNLGWNLMLRDQPDYRVDPVNRSLGSNSAFSKSWRDTYRFWSVMDENSFNGSVNKEIKSFKIGGSYLKKLRNFKARIFRYDAIDLLNEITNNTDRYSADFDLLAGYVQFDKKLNNFKINAGLRTEQNVFEVKTSDFSGQPVMVDRNYLDFLPSLNLSYQQGKSKWRLSASKTLARPEFREVANFSYYDFVRNAQILGNSKLEKTDIYNLDTKWEFYPRTGENISISFFGKKLDSPIEQIVDEGSVPSNLILTYSNPKSAQLIGIELEIRKKICSWFDFYSNATISNSSVDLKNRSRQLQGQSNYVINSGINFIKGKNILSVSYNRVGERISAVGFQGYPDIFENSRDVIDLVFLRKFGKGEFKFSIGDLLAQPTKFYQKQTNRDLIETNNEQSISLSINFKL